MRQIVLCAILLTLVLKLPAQNCDPARFERLIFLSRKEAVTDSEFTNALALVKNLERNNCPDYTKKRNGDAYVEAGRTDLFGKICVKNNSRNAVAEYIKYMKRHHGSAEEQISFSFDSIFEKRPEDVLSIMGYNSIFLEQLAWGFLNNHGHLTQKSYKTFFFGVNPAIQSIYPKYKKSIDYLLNSIKTQLQPGK